MELQLGNNGGVSGDEHEAFNSGNKGKKAYHRHTCQQILQLEKYYKIIIEFILSITIFYVLQI
jgi:homeobox-leucine zipper protein